MFRTRDFILLFSTIMFLMMAIGTTLINQGWANDSSKTATLNPETQQQYVATIAGSAEISRAERITQMRSKISQESFVSEVLPEEVEQEELEATTTGEVADDQLMGVVQCPAYRPYVSFWDARGLSLVESEGARVLTRGEVSSTSIPEVALQLPAPVVPSNNPSCLGSDVIGIANDGSLIRNDEMPLYSIFGSETLLGYALDGFPIYGTGVAEADSCGGLMVGGQYRYQLNSSRQTVLNCFAAAPVNLP